MPILNYFTFVRSTTLIKDDEKNNSYAYNFPALFLSEGPTKTHPIDCS
jgi:hypothetical protein